MRDSSKNSIINNFELTQSKTGS